MLARSWVAIALVCVGCRKATPDPPAPVNDAAPAAPLAIPARPIDTTFVVASDTHFGVGGIEEVNARMIERIGSLPEKAWPAPLAGKIGALDGVVVTGDLTEWGRPEEWERFVAFWGGRGT